jgi:hypothetical protein
MGSELQVLKKIAQDPKSKLAIPGIRQQPEVFKAVRYAASAWLIRAKLGMAHLQTTAAWEYGGHVLVTAYESGRFFPQFPT